MQVLLGIGLQLNFLLRYTATKFSQIATFAMMLEAKINAKLGYQSPFRIE